MQVAEYAKSLPDNLKKQAIVQHISPRHKELKKFKKDELIGKLIRLEEVYKGEKEYFESEIERLAGRPKPPPLIASFALGLLMPVFSIFFAGVAGTLIKNGVWTPAIFLVFAGAAGLWVSLSHVTEAIVAMTGSEESHSRLLAFAFEVGIVGLEMTNVMGMDFVSHEITYGLMGLLGIVVAMGNMIAFARHRRKMMEDLNE